MRPESRFEALSAYVDGELTTEETREVEQLLAGSSEAQETMDQFLLLRRELHDLDEPGPDVAGRVLGSIQAADRRWTTLGVKAAAVFAAGLIAGVAFIGLGPGPPSPMAVADVPDEVVAAQSLVDSLQADLRVVERGRHPHVPERVYTGRLSYRSPESLAIHLQDETDYPSSEWTPNHVSHVIDEDTDWSRAVASCPTEALPECTPTEPRVAASRNREPFPTRSISALDVVVPVGGFVRADTPTLVGFGSRDDREAIGVRITAAQLAGLIEALTGRGNWREVHPTDPVELWLDIETLVPLAFSVYPADSPERELWAIRRGYADRPDVAVLEAEWQRVEVNETVAALSPPPGDARVVDFGFVEEAPPDLARVGPEELPEGMTLHRSGTIQVGSGPEVSVAAWTDGRAWLKLEWTTGWSGTRLFGDLGLPVRTVDVGGEVAYLDERGDRIALHGPEVDAVLSGSLPAEDLVTVAGRLGLSGRPVPEAWDEAAPGTLDEATTEVQPLLVPRGLRGFSGPAVRVDPGSVSLSYAGAGNRAFVLTQTQADRLPPPLEADVRRAAVRGVEGRYTPERGLLEWAEGDMIFGLRSTTLSLEELTGIAGALEPA